MKNTKKDFAVLIVDDSPVYRQLVAETLGLRKESVLMAETGEEALRLFAKHHPSIVITDWLMPDISGIELCRQIRERSRGSYTYMILLTSMAETQDVVNGLEAGADDYLTKPFHRDELLARIGVGHRILTMQRQLEAQNRLLEQSARTDALTGLPNRRAIEEWADRQILGASRYGFPFWIVLLELDRFKNITDTYGQSAGDMILVRFGRILLSCTRNADMCGRLGNHRFIMVVTHTNREKISFVLKRIRRQFEAENFAFGGQNVHVTASFGIAGFQDDEKHASALAPLVEEAEHALREAKGAGHSHVKTPVKA